ncbi:hypothetical protein BAY61_03945 [Prauserella marina]|uniref:Uncharacterized protein n=1 Tax=Prauserella marina TaxID=530584 RepID=A0A222VKD5_9PSEU|nr:hypothetical protein [Prauserella marina]ASR34282.1 hypothetical protein BAY61_03945 [Prauserella marina]PWV71944.1 hypothetical protein DES30_111115 [Prauserella marina]SDD91568.1 hypothetical protein SAMN05421630_114114 [Prauserella marina]
MDPRDRADAVLFRAQARDGVVTPDNMTSPMDAANTQQIPRSLVRRIDGELDPDTTTKLSAAFIERNDGQFDDSHLAASAPTSRMEPRTQPFRTQSPQTAPSHAEPDRTQPLQVQSQAMEPEHTEMTGLVPTTRTFQGHSDFARRLEGL